MGLDDDMAEFEVPAAVPTSSDAIARAFLDVPRDPLERQKSQEKMDFEAKRIRRRQQVEALQAEFQSKFKNLDELFIT